MRSTRLKLNIEMKKTVNMSKFFTSSFRTQLRIKDIERVSKVERGQNGAGWTFRIEMCPLAYEVIYHNTEYLTKFEAVAVREALHARL